ncbi:benzoate-CoA ligase family protein [Alteraurantiacibacter buctensis]|uniref:Benzoate-CoA ligase family protein n=1 Tax=Alteraurantiacibacter buctensis TaxID=1503981 RepID=A0A844Z179_9SPHN|nr:benzoate-CoA ligase family protein [Alteraurantiacibacter buctensis]MXO73006.1 benzoate-CoA ligase family protein [Alteraurantiacibacter buctensis]
MNTSDGRCAADLPEYFNAAEDLLAANLARHPGKTAIIDHRGTCTYRELGDRVARMADVFNRLGVRRDQRVLLCLTDTRDFPTVFLGAMRAGVIPVPLNTLLTEDDYGWILNNSGAVAVFVSGELSDKWQAIAAAEPFVKFVGSEGGPFDDLEALLADAQPAPDPAPTHRDDVAFWLYTSGSTGRPKGAMHLHGSIRLTANLYALGTMGLREDDVVLSVAKQFFAYGLGNSLSFPYAAGATVVLHNGRSTPDAISALIVEHQVSVLGGVPTFFAGWLAHPSCPTKQDAPRLRIATSAGEALPGHIGKAFADKFGADVLDGLGSTEMLHIFVSQRPGSVRYGCTGRVVDGYRVRLVGDDGSEVPPGEIGNLQICGPTSAIGYWRNREKSTATFCGEWTASGDKYVCDEEGWLTYAGRADDMLKVGGIYVSPIEVEETLSGHNMVLEAAVVGAEDADGLVKPHAYVVLHNDVQPTPSLEQELKDHCKSHLAPYKYPRWITFVAELPKTATGKIQRFRLREDA